MIRDLPGEEWRPVLGFEGLYKVSSYGRIVSLGTDFRRPYDYVLRPFMHGRQVTPTVGLSLGKVNSAKQRKVSGVVAEAFLGARQKGRIVCHNDGNPWNNHVTNLRWGTHRSNQIDRKLHGTAMYGEQVPTAKLTEEKVEVIRYLKRELHMNTRLIATHFGVSKSAIERASRGSTWNKAAREFNNLDAARQADSENSE